MYYEQKKKFSLCNVSDSLSDSEMKQVKGGGWGDNGFYNPPPDIVNICEQSYEPMCQCQNQWGQILVACCLMIPAYLGLELAACPNCSFICGPYPG